MKILLVLVTLTLAACGPKLPPNVSPEANVAIRGNQVVSALRAVIPEVKNRTCSQTVPPPCLLPQDAVKVFAVLETAGKTGEQLATVLSAVDAAKTAAEKTSGMEKARALLASISTSLQTALAAPSDIQVRTQMIGIFDNVTKLLLAVSTF